LAELGCFEQRGLPALWIADPSPWSEIDQFARELVAFRDLPIFLPPTTSKS
jgi:hypothetical protein